MLSYAGQVQPGLENLTAELLPTTHLPINYSSLYTVVWSELPILGISSYSELDTYDKLQEHATNRRIVKSQSLIRKVVFHVVSSHRHGKPAQGPRCQRLGLDS